MATDVLRRGEPGSGYRPRGACSFCHGGGRPQDTLLAPCECNRLVHQGCLQAWKRLNDRCVRCYARNRMIPLVSPQAVVSEPRCCVLDPRPRYVPPSGDDIVYIEDLIKFELHFLSAFGTLVAAVVSALFFLTGN